MRNMRAIVLSCCCAALCTAVHSCLNPNVMTCVCRRTESEVLDLLVEKGRGILREQQDREYVCACMHV